MPDVSPEVASGTADGSADGTIKQASRPREFQRAYKACVPCRQRKARCELDVPTDGSVPSPPCTRCRRALRQCVFTEERAWKRQKLDADHRPSASARPTEPRAAARQSNWGAGVGPVPTTEDSPANALDSPQSPPRQQWRHPSSASQNSGLANSMIRTVVANGNDALNLLFEAATREDADTTESTFSPTGAQSQAAPLGETDPSYTTPGSTLPVNSGLPTLPPVQLSDVSPQVLNTWKTCRFVRMGWFTAREAVTYVDLFFRNMSPLSPVLMDYYASHAKHYQLVTQEPFLCCTILALSSRYHVLPGIGGASRGYFIHHRLWEHCQHLIMRIMLGQEKSSPAKTRTVGSIEALLLISEWHPRALHFPPESDGWDAGLVAIDPDPLEGSANLEGTSPASNRWLEDVIEPARRSDRMSWMLLGCGLSLAHELGIFDQEDKDEKKIPGESRVEAKRRAARFVRARKLLYVFVEQLASRIGCTSMIPQSLSHTVMGKSFAGEVLPGADHCEAFVAAWIELTKFVKSVSDMLFPSASFTRQILRSGRYIGLLQHFQPLLANWRGRYLDSQRLGDVLQDMLSIEYQFVRIFTNSLGLQAVVERTLDEADGETTFPMSVDSTDYEFIQEVVDGSCEILRTVIKLADNDILRFCPVRIFLHITTSAIYLLKGLSLGVWNTKLQSSFDLLDRGIHALRSGTLDDMHLAARYATLLEMHVARLRRGFVISSRPPKLTTRPPSADRHTTSNPHSNSNNNAFHTPTPTSSTTANQRRANVDSAAAATAAADADADADAPPNHDHLGGFDASFDADDWLTLPFDPSMAPFGAGGSSIQTFPGLDAGMLNFLWNLPS
ncbi:uncharacterized protein K452DRAFT_315350 [Aplosporella prunicola CBS 121167]|uniref:Zn(2)-C6 fungal-type domain-containing protein n=1 Tax=Aplosporella prunicola CBS 121167 TaxID=1176127 RepID=A0A6A6BS27_9PEZI|nr:uncharacterized protein K452DRAFT_315350 [Aplosporella prunicola CBS 121167]KAF2146095.1 hypothetical protein K452DRAFT_315350 [Aplosporella prunicola CBS 121167]